METPPSWPVLHIRLGRDLSCLRRKKRVKFRGAQTREIAGSSSTLPVTRDKYRRLSSLQRARFAVALEAALVSCALVARRRDETAVSLWVGLQDGRPTQRRSGVEVA